MSFDLTGQHLTRVECEVTLQVVTAEGWFITVENDYEWRGADGALLTTIGGEEDRIVATLTEAIGSPLTTFSYSEDGRLTFGVAAGEVRVAASEQFESWGIVGPDKERVISLPGGELAIWS